MLTYIFFFTPFLLCAIKEAVIKPRKTDRALLAFLAVFAVLFIGLRYHTGADWSGYIRTFDRSLKIDREHSAMEYGYVLLNRPFKYIFDNYYVLQFTVTSFVVFVVYKFITRYSRYPLVSLCFFLLFFLVNC